MTRSRRDVRRVWIVWSCRAVPGGGFSRIGVASTTTFNMGNPNWTQTLRLGMTNSCRCLLQVPGTFGEKFLTSLNNWMNSVGAWISEVAAKMFVSWRVRSNSTKLAHLSMLFILALTSTITGAPTNCVCACVRVLYLLTEKGSHAVCSMPS